MHDLLSISILCSKNIAVSPVVLVLNDLLGKECFSTRPLDWTVTAGMEWKWRSSITKYVEAFLELGIPRFPKVG